MPERSKNPGRLTRALLVFVLGTLVLVAGLASYLLLRQAEPTGRGTAGSSGIAQIGGPFQLVDQTGRPRSEADFRGRYLLIYFGYTFCPDVCPVSVMNMSQAVDLLAQKDGAIDDKVVPLFITVDPERDDVATMAAYAGHFRPGLMALTGSPEQVAAAAKAYRVYYRKVEDESASDYLMDHSSFIYLMGPDGAYVAHFSHNSSPEEIAAGLERYLGS